MAAAAIWPGHGGFHVTDVVTAGSPTAQVPGSRPAPTCSRSSSSATSSRSSTAQPNPDSVEQTTLTFDAHPDAGVLAHHGYDAYEQGAALADASTDPSVSDAVQSLHQHGFLGQGGQVTSQVFQITRAP